MYNGNHLNITLNLIVIIINKNFSCFAFLQTKEPFTHCEVLSIVNYVNFAFIIMSSIMWYAPALVCILPFPKQR